jgi:NTE family protein
MSDVASPANPIVEEEAAAMPDSATPKGIGLCLSGGGYRAMLFHLGGLIRLNQLGELRHVARVSSVSGGSITAGLLGLRWKGLEWDGSDRATNLDELVVQPIIEFAGRVQRDRHVQRSPRVRNGERHDVRAA